VTYRELLVALERANTPHELQSQILRLANAHEILSHAYRNACTKILTLRETIMSLHEAHEVPRPPFEERVRDQIEQLNVRVLKLEQDMPWVKAR